MIIRKLGLIVLTLLFCFADAGAFTKLKTGQQPEPFVLVDADGKEVASDRLWNKITILTIMRENDRYTKRVLEDISQVANKKDGRSCSIWIVIEGEVNRRLTLEVPKNIRDGVLFDTSGALDKLFGLVVLPATGVFSSGGNLMAYFPLWRQTLREELGTGLDLSLGESDLDSVSGVWRQQTRRDEILREVKALWAAEKKDSAIALIISQVDSDSTWLEGTLLLGKIKLRTRDFVFAYDLFAGAKNRFQPSSEILLGLSRAAIGLGQFKEAQEHLATGRYMTARPEEFLRLESEIHYQMQQTDSAIFKWRSAVESLLGKPQGVTQHE